MAPRQRPHQSEQVVATPPAFLDRVRANFGPITLDVAALPTNAVAPTYFTPEQDGLAQSWEPPVEDVAVHAGHRIDRPDEWAWCNPPFGQCAKWVQKAYEEALAGRARSLVLVPASVGTNWWDAWVHRKASVLFLRPRLTFVGHTAPYPKDLALLVYTHAGVHGQVAPQPCYFTWAWRTDGGGSNLPIPGLR